MTLGSCDFSLCRTCADEEEVERLPFDYMVIYVWTLWAAALLIMLGAKYRYAAVYFFVGTSYLFFLDAVNYLNHMYLVMCISFLLIFLPCDVCFSIDAYKSGEHLIIER